jgi:hypothetical protein
MPIGVSSSNQQSAIAKAVWLQTNNSSAISQHYCVQLLPAIQYEGLLLWGKSGRRVRLTTHLQIMTLLRMSGAVPQLTSCDFIA